MSKIIPIFYIEKQDGKFDRERLDTYLNQIKDGKYKITVQEVKKIRSLSQNNLYWLYLTAISVETGEDDIRLLHEIFKRKYLPPVIKTLKGKNYNLPGSTTRLTKFEFMEYMNKIERDTEIPIPSLDCWRIDNCG